MSSLLMKKNLGWYFSIPVTTGMVGLVVHPDAKTYFGAWLVGSSVNTALFAIAKFRIGISADFINKMLVGGALSIVVSALGLIATR